MQVLFRTISKEEEDALRGRYAGTQAERNSAAGGRDKKAADKGVHSNGQPLSGPAPSCTFVGDCLYKTSKSGTMSALLETRQHGHLPSVHACGIWCLRGKAALIPEEFNIALSFMGVFQPR